MRMNKTTLALLLTLAGRPLWASPSPPTSRACAGCHAEIYAEWQGSRHAGAHAARSFLAAFRREPQPWCLSCHAPLPAAQAALQDVPRRTELAALQDRLAATPASEGVGCILCHARNGRILSPRPPSAAAQAAHPMQLEPALGTPEFCAGCHQVNWPRQLRPLAYSAVPMLDTLAEFRAAGAPSGRCQSCHMRAGAHDFAGGHDPALWRRTLTARAVRLAPDRVRIDLCATGAGHRVPTGDPFHRLQLDLCADAACELPLASHTLGRVFTQSHGEQRLLRDTRLPAPAPGQRAVVQHVMLALPPDSPQALRLRVSYLYVAPSTESDLEPGEIASVLFESAVE
jgi:hypothetical protein